MSCNDAEVIDFISDCRILYKISSSTIKKLLNIDIKEIELQILADRVSDVQSITNLYQQMMQTETGIRPRLYSNDKNLIRIQQYEIWMRRISYQYDSLLHSIRKMIENLFELYTKETLCTSFRLIEYFNELESLDISINTDIRFTNPSSTIFENKKRYTLRKILKIIARNRTRQSAQYFVDYLEKKFDEMDRVTVDSSISSRVDVDDEIFNNVEDDQPLESDTTSILVFKTLTQYTSPAEPAGVISVPNISNGETAMAHIVLSERTNLSFLFYALTSQPTTLLNASEIKYSKKNGGQKICKLIKRDLLGMYERYLWQNIGVVGEHELLWWSEHSLGRKRQLISQKFNSWLKQYYSKGNLHPVIQPTIQSFIDCLCCYITSTSWDELFSHALISAKYQHSSHELGDIGLGTRTGHLFSDMLYEIVFLTNSCEGSNWTTQDLENLPLVEQIPLLHRLDHSIHNLRIWAIGRAKHLTNCWNMEQFFRVTHVDINASLYALSQLKISQNIKTIEENENSHFLVCSKMRSKLISEVQANIEKLRDVPNRSLTILSSVCKRTSSSFLCCNFPKSKYRHQQNRNDNKKNPTTDYVEKYLDEVLKPVLLASQNLPLPIQKSVSKLILEILCEAWLDYIYKSKIKFSKDGAIELLIDFALIPTWIRTKVDIGDDIRQFLQSAEILRRCEGVGRLLLRQPGEAIVMYERSDSKETKSNDVNNIETLMPPEMYVPNQKKWLELRLNRRKSPLSKCC